MDINQLVDTGFNLDYLGTEEFPFTEYKSICILGGGTAGYLSALALRRCRPELKITIIESSKIPVIGVGESTTTEIVPFLHNFLDLDPEVFFKEVKPTIKLGIQFDWGRKDTKPFNFNFFAGHLAENFAYENHTGSFNWPSELMYQNKVPVIYTDNKKSEKHSFLNSIPFAYHLDNKSLISFLNKTVKQRGINIMDAEVDNAELSSSGEITSLAGKDLSGNAVSFAADFFIDCTGFRSVLLGKTMKQNFVSYKDSLLCDSAITFTLPNNSEPSPYTGAITMNAGWTWKIPMRDDDHFGYVHSSEYLSKEEALNEIEEKFGPIKGHNFIPFRSGRHENAVTKNCFAVGNSYAFIEPLESTAIQTLVQSIMIFCRLLPRNAQDNQSRKAINSEIAENWDSFKAFLAIHYKYNFQKDTAFWTYVRENVKLGRGSSAVELYHQKAPLAYTHFGSQSSFVANEDLVFNSYSYDSLLFGQGLKPKQSFEPRFSEKELKTRLESYRSLSELALSQKELFSNEESFLQEVLKPLFENHDSWIRETMV